MTTHRNAERVRNAYAEWDRSKGENVDVWLDLMAECCELSSICGGVENAEFTERCQSLDDVRRYFAGLTSQWRMISVKMNEFITDGDRVVALGRHIWQNRATGRTVDTAKCDVFRFENGKAVAISEFYDSHALVSAATP